MTFSVSSSSSSSSFSSSSSHPPSAAQVSFSALQSLIPSHLSRVASLASTRGFERITERTTLPNGKVTLVFKLKLCSNKKRKASELDDSLPAPKKVKVTEEFSEEIVTDADEISLDDLTAEGFAISRTRKREREIEDFIQKNPQAESGFKHYSEAEMIPRLLVINPRTRVPDELELRKLPAPFGYGIFARNKLKKGTFLNFYSGVYLFDGERSISSKYIWDVCVGEKTLIIDGAIRGNYLKFINSSEAHENIEPLWIRLTHPNGKVSHQILYVVSKVIQSGQQLLIPYGENYWKCIRDENGKKIKRIELEPDTFTLRNGKIYKKGDPDDDDYKEEGPRRSKISSPSEAG